MATFTSKNKKILVDYVVPFLALVIAVFAFFVSIWEGYENRTHNRLIVTPILSIDEKMTNSSPTFLGIILTNQGYGPAIINSFDVYYKGKKIDEKGDRIWEIIYNSHFSTPLTFVIEWNSFQQNMVVGMGEEKVLWGERVEQQSEYDKELANSISDISIKIKYSSVYGMKYETEFNTGKLINSSRTE